MKPESNAENPPATQPRVKRRTLAVLIGLFVFGFAVMWVGDKLAVQPILDSGLAILGIGFVTAGIVAFLTREVAFADSESMSGRKQTYRGIAAICWGVIFEELGLGIITIAVLRLFGADRAAVDFLISRPGILFFTVGLMLVCFGGMALFDQDTSSSSLLSSLAAFLLRTVGIVPLLLGIALITVGLLEMAAPAVFDSLIPPLPDFSFPPTQ